MRAHAAKLKSENGGQLKESIPSDFKEKFHRSWISLAPTLTMADLNEVRKSNFPIKSYTFNESEEHVSPDSFSMMLSAYGFIPQERIVLAAINSRNLRYLELLLEEKQNIVNTSLPPLARSMLHLTCINGDFKKLQLLLNYGANINKRDADHRTPLILSIKPSTMLNANNIILRLLAERKIHVNWKDRKGLNALHYACITGNQVAIEWLIRRGARIDVMDNSGKMPCDYAKGKVSFGLN